MTTNRQKSEPDAPGSGKRADREARLAAALRENLRRRKNQKNARESAAPPSDQGGGGTQRR